MKCQVKKQKIRKALLVSEKFKIRPQSSLALFFFFFFVCKNSHKLKWKMNESHQNNSLALLPLPPSPACHPTRHPRFFPASATSLVAFRSSLRGLISSDVDDLPTQIFYCCRQSNKLYREVLIIFWSIPLMAEVLSLFKAFCYSSVNILPLIA